MKLGNVYASLSDTSGEEDEAETPTTYSPPPAPEVMTVVMNALKAFQQKTPFKAKISDAERERRKAQNLCFFCGKGGHRQSECPMLQKRQMKPKN